MDSVVSVRLFSTENVTAAGPVSECNYRRTMYHKIEMAGFWKIRCLWSEGPIQVSISVERQLPTYDLTYDTGSTLLHESSVRGSAFGLAAMVSFLLVVDSW